MTSEPAARRLVVSGRVQGVFFRTSCQEQAEALGLSGWVRNTSAGAVEAWVEGEPARIDDLVRWCREGPRLDDVDEVEVHEESPTRVLGFRVR